MERGEREVLMEIRTVLVSIFCAGVLVFMGSGLYYLLVDKGSPENIAFGIW